VADGALHHARLGHRQFGAARADADEVSHESRCAG
jgi:hypothetical protein